MNTHQQIDVASKAGKAFLRRVVRNHEDWSLYAEQQDGWKVKFWRRIDGDIGNPDETVTVETNEAFHVSGSPGIDKCFREAKPVAIPEVTRVCLDAWSGARAAAKLLAEGWRLEILYSRGSESSAEHGLGFVSVRAYVPNQSIAVELGTGTVFINGTQVVAGGCST